MAQATYSVSTSTTNLSGLWRKVQAPLRQATNFMYDEWDELDEMQEFAVDWSAREITMPLDINEEVGVASIPEGGNEARPSSVTVVDASFTWILLNARFTISKTAKFIDQKNRAAMLENQFKFQGRKKLQAVARRISDYFYGFGTGIVATTSTVATQASGTYTIKDMYGIVGLGATTAPFQVADMFRVGEWVALIRTAALVTNAIGVITAVTPATPSIAITWNGSVTSANNDGIVFANSLENTTIAGTDYNAALTGFLDAYTSTSLHGVSSATYANWQPSYSNTTTGRFTGIKLRKMRQATANKGGGKLDSVVWSQGIENDVTSQLQAGLRFNDAWGMEMDGAPKSKGINFRSGRRVPGGYVFGYVKESIRKMVLLPRPGQPTWDDAEKIQNVSGYVFPMDYPCQMVYLTRANLAYESNKAEQ